MKALRGRRNASGGRCSWPEGPLHLPKARAKCNGRNTTDRGRAIEGGPNWTARIRPGKGMVGIGTGRDAGLYQTPIVLCGKYTLRVAVFTWFDISAGCRCRAAKRQSHWGGRCECHHHTHRRLLLVNPGTFHHTVLAPEILASLSGQQVPIVIHDLRGMYNWETGALIERVIGERPPVDGTEKVPVFEAKEKDMRGFLERI
jgi:hypothetical protein